MPDSRAFILTGDYGKPWRIPGSVPSLPVFDGDRTNDCGNPQCKGASDHAPDQVYLHVPHDPDRQRAMLRLNIGGK